MHISSHDEKIREEQATDTDDEELSSKKSGENNVKDYTFRCNQCDRSYPDEKRLKWHMRCHRSKTHICPICGKPFSFWYLTDAYFPTFRNEKKKTVGFFLLQVFVEKSYPKARSKPRTSTVGRSYKRGGRTIPM